jgi:protein-S-isoprenylcysteine O-methyltransferase Ste14
MGGTGSEGERERLNLKWISGGATVVLAGCILWLYFAHSLFGNSALTIALQVAAALLMLWARLTFGRRSFHATANPTAGGLVTKGPYRYWRHPIYASVLYFVWTGVAVHWSASAAGVALLATLMIAARIVAEESFLRQEYPGYAVYSQRTRRIIPFVF